MQISRKDQAAIQHANDLIRAALDSLQKLSGMLRSDPKLHRDVEIYLESIEEAQLSVRSLSRQLESYTPGD